MELLRPMKAESLLPDNVEHTDVEILKAMECLRYPVWASVKLDGIRAVRTNDLWSASHHLIPNLMIRYRSMKFPSGFDFELCNEELQYHEVESIVMSREHPRHDKIKFYVIDFYDEQKSYLQRMQEAERRLDASWGDVVFKFPTVCSNAKELFQFFITAEELNGEGICFRTGSGPYKQGRSTLKEQYLVKLCRYVRTECKVVSIEEQQYNGNKAKTNAIGLTERSSMKHNQRGKGTLGAIVVEHGGLQFRVGSGVGWTQRWRQEMFDNQDLLLGKTITIKSKKFGEKNKPRHPIMVGMREEGF